MNDSQEDKVKSAPDVFGKLFMIFIGLPAGLYLGAMQIIQDKSFIMVLVYFFMGLFVPGILGRAIDHMIFINNRELGENISEFIPIALAAALAIGLAVIAFNIVGGLWGVIAAIVAAVVVFVWFLK